MTQWIIAIASSATALSVFLLWKQLKADHERSRRERALELMRFFTDNINQAPLGLRYATQLVRHLDETQCMSLWNLDPFDIEKKYEYLIRGCMENTIEHYEIDCDEKSIHLDKRELAVVRSMVVSLLNTMETVAAAWRHNVADQRILEEEGVLPQRKDYSLGHTPPPKPIPGT